MFSKLNISCHELPLIDFYPDLVNALHYYSKEFFSVCIKMFIFLVHSCLTTVRGKVAHFSFLFFKHPEFLQKIPKSEIYFK